MSLENDGAGGGIMTWLASGGTSIMTLDQNGALAVTGGFALNGGTLALPSGSITTPMIANNAVTNVDLATNSFTNAKNFTFASGTGTGIAIVDCGTGFTPIFGSIIGITLAPPNPRVLINCACTSAACTACENDPVARLTSRFWMTKGKSVSTVTNLVACMATQ
jgi:hypothetical protein